MQAIAQSLAQRVSSMIAGVGWCLAPAFWDDANRRLRGNGLPKQKFVKNPAKPVLVHPSLGKELCILCWAVEDAERHKLEKSSPCGTCRQPFRERRRTLSQSKARTTRPFSACVSTLNTQSAKFQNQIDPDAHLHKNVFVRMTIQLPDETFRQLKIEAATSGMKLKDLVSEFVQKGLAGRATHAPVSRARSPLPVIRRPTGKTHPSMTNAKIEKLLTSEDCHAGS